MKNKPSLLIIFLSVFIDLIGFGIVMPLLPQYSKQFGASGFQIGAIIASFSLMQFLFAPAWGRLSDRIGRRPVILISNAGSAGAYALFAYASTLQGQTGLWILLGSRIFAGICGANLSVASAYIADISPPEKRTARMGLIGMAFGVGSITGPALAGSTNARWGLAAPGWVAAGLCFFNFVLGLFVLAESWKPGAESKAGERAGFGQMMATVKRPLVGPLIILYFFATFCFAVFESTFIRVVIDQYDMTISHATYLLSFCGICSAVIQGGGVGKLNKKFGEKKLIVGSLFTVAISMAFLPFVTSLAAIMFWLAIFAGGSGLNRPPTFGLISMSTSANEQGGVMGVAQSSGSLARIFAPIFGNVLYEYSHSLPYVICAVIALLSTLWARSFLRKAPASPAQAKAV
ncbi:MAG: MFS transporter [Verrucomicrobiales bacterium]